MSAKTLVVTGGSGAIGEAIVRRFALSGDRVCFSYFKQKQKALTLENELKRINPSIKAFELDVSSPQSVGSFYLNVRREYGKADILVNNAGIAQQKLFIDISEEDLNAMLQTNLNGVFRVSRAFLSDMLSAKSGSIVNISSMWGICGASCEVHYSAAKAGVIGFTKALAKEAAAAGVRVNCVAPGVIKTPMLNAFSEEELLELANQTPLGRLGTPEDVANAVYFLANDEASFITGEVLSVDGGFIL